MTGTPNDGQQLRDRIADAVRPVQWQTYIAADGYPSTAAGTPEEIADAVLAVVQPELDAAYAELATARAAGMREAAAMLRRYCPDHGTADTCSMDCHCEAADEIERDARAAAPTTPMPEADAQLAQAGTYVAYAYSRREGANSLGKYHIILNQPLDSGRLHRMAGDSLCRPGRQFWGLEPRPRADADCPRCLRLASQHGVTVPAAVSAPTT